MPGSKTMEGREPNLNELAKPIPEGHVVGLVISRLKGGDGGPGAEAAIKDERGGDGGDGGRIFIDPKIKDANIRIGIGEAGRGGRPGPLARAGKGGTAAIGQEPPEATLLSPPHPLGEQMSIEEFGDKFDLDKDVVAKLKDIGYLKATALTKAKRSVLERYGFLVGQIDGIEDALERWSKRWSDQSGDNSGSPVPEGD